MQWEDKMLTAKEKIEHRDKLGRILKVGDCIAYPDHNSLTVGTVKRISAKMVIVAELNTRGSRESRKYPSDVVLLEGPDVSMYLLKLSSSQDKR